MANQKVEGKLSNLTQRQIEVLQLVCNGYTYKSIGEQLVVAESTVKAHMGNIYQKLDLDQLPPTQRTRTIFELYCPALKSESIQVEIGPEEPDPVPENIEKMVEEDEQTLVVWQPGEIIEVEPIEIRPVRRPRRWPWLVVGIILGLIIGVVGLNTFQPETNTQPLVQVSPVIELVEVTVAVPVEQTVVVTATAGPEEPTQTPIVEERVVVVTATQLPPPTKPAITSPDTVLEVGEWWKQEDIWLKLTEFSYDENAVLFIEMEIWNKGERDLIFEWIPAGNTSLVDNTGHHYQLSDAFARGSNSEIIKPNEVVELTHDLYSATASYYDQHFFNKSVTDLTFTIIEISRVPFAQWRISVPK